MHIADCLGCSLDYLFCRTDVPEMAAAQADMGGSWVKLAYIDSPKPPQEVQEALALFDLGDNLGLYRTFVRWNGKQWTFLDGVRIEGECVGWYPIPPTPDKGTGRAENDGEVDDSDEA